MNNKIKLSYIFLFILLPAVFLLSSFIWRLLIHSHEFLNVATDALGILGIYYVLISVIFMFLSIKNVNLKNI
ncbi:hypothetical protein J2S17_004132 [Cytobacillus purgationiresistens]|uniref:Uncharacterized protein n=1 Tax=Cytobacillus purgationiresistens TaxID=863449 RepID=A0ABU0AQC0_9BACI|nr:hypothetical protein [Cytobacillus purgationiresistens]